MFGMANASVNALCSMPAPMNRLCSISRASPKTRESAVNAPTVAVFLSIRFIVRNYITSPRRIFAIIRA